jgi:hypothetical protein
MIALNSYFFTLVNMRKNKMQNGFIKEIVSGGQTGVDRAALDIAIEFDIPHSGWCPYGRVAEDGVIPSKYNLKESPQPTHEENLDKDAIYKKRTELNVRDSDGTLVIVKDDPMGGTLYTIQMAKKYKKLYFIFYVSDTSGLDNVVDWIIKNNIHKLNVAGPRESQVPGIYDLTSLILSNILNRKS